MTEKYLSNFGSVEDQTCMQRNFCEYARICGSSEALMGNGLHDVMGNGLCAAVEEVIR